MHGWEFPVIGTKVAGVTRPFNLTDPEDRREYFIAKAAPEMAKVQKFLGTNTFVAFFLGKKNSGKGTYWSLLRELFGTSRMGMISVGDLVRDLHSRWDEYTTLGEYQDLKRFYRGYMSFDEAVARLHGRSTSTLLPTEFILAALKARMAGMEKKAVFIDGLPRDLDQVSYSLFFRDLANYRDDPDLFIMIDIPMSVIDERIKYRVVCPKCHNSRNTKLFVTRDIGYDQTRTEFYPPSQKTPSVSSGDECEEFLLRRDFNSRRSARKNPDRNVGEFYLKCDNPECLGERMVPKEGDNLGIGLIGHRLDKDEEVFRQVAKLHGVPQIQLRNHIPVAEAGKFDDYELTPEYVLRWAAKKGRVEVQTKPWVVADDNGVLSYSLLAPPVALSLVRQLPAALGIS